MLIGAGIGLFSQLASDLVTSAIDGELSFSHWTSYVGAAAGGAVGNIMPGSKVLGDVIGSTVSTIVGMGGHNIVNRIQGKQSEYSDEEIMYTAMNNAMLTGLTSTVVRNCKYAADLESFKLPIPKIEITGMDLAVGAFPAYVDGIRNSKPFSTLSKWAHGW